MKPDNFLIGHGKKQNVVYVIDFGLAKRYRDPKTGEHIPHKDNKSLTGTARYASVNAHLGIEQSRRDDLESIGHVLLYFLRGSLPWQGQPGRSKAEKYANIKKQKKETSIEDLCKDQPDEFKEFMQYCRGLNFTADPDYGYIINLFESCLKRHGFDEKNADFIWNKNRLEIEKAQMKKEMIALLNKKGQKKKGDDFTPKED